MHEKCFHLGLTDTPHFFLSQGTIVRFLELNISVLSASVESFVICINFPLIARIAKHHYAALHAEKSAYSVCHYCLTLVSC